jgi:anti-sigma regulatory factor (Ser/Thr protein kinase)
MYTAIRLAADASSASRARRSVEWFAHALRADPGLAPLVTTELVSNAVRHGAEPIVLLLRSSGNRLLVEVTDCGAGHVQPRLAPGNGGPDEGGLGLALVTSVATAWGVRRHGRRCKTVWASLAAEPTMVAWAEVAGPDLDVGLVSELGLQERRIAAQERDRAEAEGLLARQAADVASLDWRATALHRAAASLHRAAAALHEQLASLADRRAQRLFDRYR